MSSEAESAVDEFVEMAEHMIAHAEATGLNLHTKPMNFCRAYLALRLRVSELEAALRGLLDMSESDAADFDHQIAFDECMEAARHQARRALRNEEGAKWQIHDMSMRSEPARLAAPKDGEKDARARSQEGGRSAAT